MKIDFEQQLKGLGRPLMAQDGETPLTLKSISIESLMAAFPDEKISGEEKFKRYQLAQRISDGDEVSVSEAAKIKDLIGKAYGPVVVGPAYELLEQKE